MEPALTRAKFERLFRDYAKLINCEAVSLREQSFEDVGRIAAGKTAILSELQRLGAELQISHEHPDLVQDFAALIEAQKHNAASIGQMLKRTQSELQMLDATARKCRALGNAYTSRNRAGSKVFCVVG